jgi:hypothetical protein
LATTGKMMRGTAAPAVPEKAPTRRRTRTDAAVVRWRLMGERSDAPVRRLEGAETNRAFGRNL